LDLAAQKPELLALVKRLASFSPSVDGHQDVCTSAHQLQHNSSVISGGSSGGGGRVRSVSVSSYNRNRHNLPVSYLPMSFGNKIILDHLCFELFMLPFYFTLVVNQEYTFILFSCDCVNLIRKCYMLPIIFPFFAWAFLEYSLRNVYSCWPILYI
jgi:hypothetical protein